MGYTNIVMNTAVNYAHLSAKARDAAVIYARVNEFAGYANLGEATNTTVIYAELEEAIYTIYTKLREAIYTTIIYARANRFIRYAGTLYAIGSYPHAPAAGTGEVNATAAI